MVSPISINQGSQPFFEIAEPVYFEKNNNELAFLNNINQNKHSNNLLISNVLPKPEINNIERLDNFLNSMTLNSYDQFFDFTINKQKNSADVITSENNHYSNIEASSDQSKLIILGEKANLENNQHMNDAFSNLTLNQQTLLNLTQEQLNSSVDLKLKTTYISIIASVVSQFKKGLMTLFQMQ